MTHTPTSKKLSRRTQNALFVVLLGATTTLVARLVTKMPLGSPELLIVTCVGLPLAWLGLRTATSKGKFRFASLLILMVVTAVAMSILIPPMKARAMQKSAIAKVLSLGGQVETSPPRYPSNALGWTETRSGYMCPAFLAHWYTSYLMPSEVYNVTIPSSLLDRETLASLQCGEFGQLTIILDGKSTSADALNDFLKNHFTREFTNSPFYYYPAVTFDAKQLTNVDLQFLNQVNRAELVFNIETDTAPSLSLIADCKKPISFRFMGMPKNPKVFDQIAAIGNLNSINIAVTNLDPALLTAINQRSETIEILRICNTNLTQQTADAICGSNRIRTLSLQLPAINGVPASYSDLKVLKSNSSIEELNVYVYGNVGSNLDSILSPKGLKFLRAYAVDPIDDAVLEAIKNSEIENIELETSSQSGTVIPSQPWMTRLKSFLIDGRNDVLPHRWNEVELSDKVR